jgi:hypothetical protein
MAASYANWNMKENLLHCKSLISINNNLVDRKTMRSYSGITQGRRRAARMKPNEALSCCTAHGETQMTATSMINIVDRFALSLMNTLVLVGLPLVAIGLVAQSF